MEALISQFTFLSDQSLHDKSFDPSTIEDLMKLFELEAYRSWAAIELEQEKEIESAQISMDEAENELDSAMDQAMEEFRRFEEEMEHESAAKFNGLVASVLETSPTHPDLSPVLPPVPINAPLNHLVYQARPPYTISIELESPVTIEPSFKVLENLVVYESEPTVLDVKPVTVNGSEVFGGENEEEFVISRSKWTPPQRLNSGEIQSEIALPTNTLASSGGSASPSSETCASTAAPPSLSPQLKSASPSSSLSITSVLSSSC